MSTDNATTRGTKQNSDRAVETVDAGFASLEKTRTAPQASHLIQPGPLSEGRVFVCPQGAGGNTESVPARLARRRLHAGPTPAALVLLGFKTCKTTDQDLINH